MSRSGNAWDIAAMESASPRSRLYGQKAKPRGPRDQARADVFDYIDEWVTFTSTIPQSV